MRRVVSLMHVSLDGFVAGPNGEMNWIKLDEDVFRWGETFIEQASTGLYGPKTFAMMESYWPEALKDPDAVGHRRNHALWYEKAVKVVFSRSIVALDNPNARLINRNVAAEIETLKRGDGADIMIFGSPGLVHSLAPLGLIDDYVLTISPVILGAGIPMFKDVATKIDLKLISSTQFAIGSLGLHYRS